MTWSSLTNWLQSKDLPTEKPSAFLTSIWTWSILSSRTCMSRDCIVLNSRCQIRDKECLKQEMAQPSSWAKGLTLLARHQCMSRWRERIMIFYPGSFSSTSLRSLGNTGRADKEDKDLTEWNLSLMAANPWLIEGCQMTPLRNIDQMNIEDQRRTRIQKPMTMRSSSHICLTSQLIGRISLRGRLIEVKFRRWNRLHQWMIHTSSSQDR